MGAIFERHGIPAVPSPTHPNPGGAPYFSGGYNLERHSSAGGGPLGGLQLETYIDGIRDGEENVRAFARTAADVLIEYLLEYQAHVPHGVD